MSEDSVAEFIKGYPFLTKKENTFCLFENNDYFVETLRIDPKHKRITRQVYQIPGTITPIKSTQKVKRTVHTHELGRSTKLPKKHFLGVLLLRNEILACSGQAVSKPGLLRTFRKEFPGTKKSTTAYYFDAFSKRRYEYNRGILYKGHTVPPLFCFLYNDDGYIQHHRYKNQIVSFEFCKRILIQSRFADPRFFTYDQLAGFREQQHLNNPDFDDWHIPDIKQVQQIEAKLGKPLFNSITFPEGYGKGSTII